MSDLPRIALVAALEREIRPLLKHRRATQREYQGRRFKFFEGGSAVLVCGGIGAEASRRATEAVIVLYEPELVLSVGFAGALDPGLKAGDIFLPGRVIDVRDGSSIVMDAGQGVLLSANIIAGAEQKAKLAEAYGAQAVDMEAAAVARGAQARGVRFAAVKAISDESDFALPSLDRFVDRNGQFRETALAASLGARPWLWSTFFKLARNSAKASKALCAELDRYIHEPKELRVLEKEMHSIRKVVT